MAQHVLDSVAIVNSALVQNEHDPWYQYQESERQQFSTFVTTSLSIINAYAMAQQTTNVTELSRRSPICWCHTGTIRLAVMKF